MKFVRKFDNFLSEELYKELISTARYLIKSPSQCFATNKFWTYDIVKDSFPVILHSIDVNSELYNKLQYEIFSKLDCFFIEQNIRVKKKAEFLLYYWTRFSYIPWHCDANYHGGLTLYLNEEWDADWGGYFMYKNEDGISAIAPSKNSAVLQYGGINHTTTAVNFNGDLRITLQLFLEKQED